MNDADPELIAITDSIKTMSCTAEQATKAPTTPVHTKTQQMPAALELNGLLDQVVPQAGHKRSSNDSPVYENKHLGIPSTTSTELQECIKVLKALKQLSPEKNPPKRGAHPTSKKKLSFNDDFQEE